MNDLSLNIIPIRKSGKYSIDEKLLSLALMDASRRDYGGVLTPEYNKISRVLDIKRQVLRLWWQDKERIYKQADALVNVITQSVAIKLSIELVHLVNSLSGTYDTMLDRDKINLLNSYITKLRLLQGRSTSNIAVKHDYTPPIATPKPKKEIAL